MTTRAILIFLLFNISISQFVLYNENQSTDIEFMDPTKFSSSEYQEMIDDVTGCVHQSVSSGCSYQFKTSYFRNYKCCHYKFTFPGGYPGSNDGPDVCSAGIPIKSFYTFYAHYTKKINEKINGYTIGDVTIDLICGSEANKYKSSEFKIETDVDKANENYLTCFLESPMISYPRNPKEACKAASKNMLDEKYGVRCTYFYLKGSPDYGFCAGIPGSFNLGEVQYVLQSNQAYFHTTNGEEIDYSSFKKNGEEITGSYKYGSAIAKQPNAAEAQNNNKSSAGFLGTKLLMVALFALILI